MNFGRDGGLYRIMRGSRRGFSLIEVLVAVAVVIVLATALLPNLLASTDRLRVQSTALVLEALSDGISTARFDNQDWPLLLSHLVHGITTNDLNICGSTYRAGTVNNWDGPYYERTFPATGLPTAIGVIRDTLEREIISGGGGGPGQGQGQGGGGAVSLLKIVVDSVPEEDARELNRIVDADGDAAAGTIRWTAPSGSGLTTVRWLRTIKGC